MDLNVNTTQVCNLNQLYLTSFCRKQWSLKCHCANWVPAFRQLGDRNLFIVRALQPAVLCLHWITILYIAKVGWTCRTRNPQGCTVLMGNPLEKPWRREDSIKLVEGNWLWGCNSLRIVNFKFHYQEATSFIKKQRFQIWLSRSGVMKSLQHGYTGVIIGIRHFYPQFRDRADYKPVSFQREADVP